MNEEDEIISVRRLRCTRTSSMSDEASLGLRLVGEPFETSCSPPIRKKIRRGIVWQVAYGVRPTPEGVAVRGEQVIGSSSPMTPYTH